MDKPFDHLNRMDQARCAASYELGDPDWADRFIDIYFGDDAPSEDALEAWY